MLVQRLKRWTSISRFIAGAAYRRQIHTSEVDPYPDDIARLWHSDLHFNM